MTEYRNETPEDCYRKIIEREAQFSTLWSRMDTDRDLWWLKDFTLVDKDNREIPDVEHVTANDPRVFAQYVIATIQECKEQIIVEGLGPQGKELQRIDERTTIIESFLRDLDYMIDVRLQDRLIGRLRDFLAEQITIRGWIAARCQLYMNGDTFIPDVLPVDTRYLTHEIGRDSLLWVSYTTTRSKAQVWREYGVETNSDYSTVRDYWDDRVERVYLEKDMVKERKHNLGYVPWVIQACPSGSLLQDNDSLAYQGESIFAANRDLYDTKNTLMSLLATLTMMAAFGPLQFRNEEGSRSPALQLPPYGKRVIVPIGKEEVLERVPMNDIRNATRLLHAELESNLQRGSLPAAEYGDVHHPLSAVALAKLTDGKHRVFGPRLRAIASFREKLARMMIDQYIRGGFDTELGRPGNQTKYSAGDLEGQYSITYSYEAVDPEQNILNLTVANAARPHYSEATIGEEILKQDDPRREARLRKIEDAERAVPDLALLNMAKAALEEGDETAALVIANQIGLTLEQIESGKIGTYGQRASARGAVPGGALLPLVGGGGPMLSAAKAAAEIEAEEPTDVEE